MGIIQIQAASDPFTRPEIGEAAATLLGRAESMGLLDADRFETVSRLDPPLIEAVLQRLRTEGLLQGEVMSGGTTMLPSEPEGTLRLLRRANTALEDSPIPGREWAALRGTLGDEMVARLCEISEVSLRRYAAGTRTTPDPIAQRLHILALIVADLRGAYNDYGVRRWFQRPRPQLGGRCPEAFLPRLWTPDHPQVGVLRKLAASIGGSPAT